MTAPSAAEIVRRIRRQLEADPPPDSAIAHVRDQATADRCATILEMQFVKEGIVHERLRGPDDEPLPAFEAWRLVDGKRELVRVGFQPVVSSPSGECSGCP